MMMAGQAVQLRYTVNGSANSTRAEQAVTIPDSTVIVPNNNS